MTEIEQIRFSLKMQSSSGLCSFDKWLSGYIKNRNDIDWEHLTQLADQSGYIQDVLELRSSMEERSDSI